MRIIEFTLISAVAVASLLQTTSADPATTPAPTTTPSVAPTRGPTKSPTPWPTFFPSMHPTGTPTRNPTQSPSPSPTASPTSSPTVSPTSNPSASPTSSPTVSPTSSPSASPTSSPTVSPTSNPSASPTSSPTVSPTNNPTASPTASPLSPTSSPTSQPTQTPTTSPIEAEVGLPVIPTYPTPVTLKTPSDGSLLPGYSVASDLVNQENSWEVAELQFQGPSISNVNRDNEQRRNCPHRLRYLKRWEAPSTWPQGVVPVPEKHNEDIILPNNARVFITAGSLTSTKENPYPKIIVPSSSELIFDDEDIEIHTLGISVQGRLRIGGEQCRIRSKINITLHGFARRTLSSASQLSDSSLKAIEVFGNGKLDIHGVRYGSTWSRLALTAKRGQNKVVLHEPVNWEPGQRVVITTTAVKDSRDWHRNEERIIENVESVEYNGDVYGVITFTTTLQYNHFGGREYQAEVGLLSRRIVIQGDDDSNPVDRYPTRCTNTVFKAGYPCVGTYRTGYGGHVKVSGPNTVGRVSGVEFFQMGQTNILARYPFHFHMLGNGGQNSYLQDSSIWKSFYRCISVHGTHKSRVSRNVAYDIIGSCYYLEDAVEEENIFEFNLAALIHIIGKPATAGGQWMANIETSEFLLNPADVTASGFYITNPYNVFVGNAASGGYSGYLIVTVPTGLGLHAISHATFSPQSRPTLTFNGNSAHSSGYWWRHGGAIYVGGYLEHPDPNDSTILRYNGGRKLGGRPAVTRLENTKVFLSTLAVNHWGRLPEIHYIEARDVTKSVNIFGRAIVSHMLVECRTQFESLVERHYGYRASNQEAAYFRGRILGFAWYDTGQRHILKDVTFRNCVGRRAYVWTILTHSNQHVPEFIQASSGIKYENVNMDQLMRFTVVDFRRPRYAAQLANWLDVDGSASMRLGTPTIIGSNLAGKTWWRFDKNCVVKPGWRVVLCDKLNTRSIGSLHVEVYPDVAPGQGQYCSNGGRDPCPVVGYANRFGQRGPLSNGLTLRHHERITGGVGGGMGWHVSYLEGVPQHLVVYQTQLPQGTDLVLAFPHVKGAPVTVYAETCVDHEQALRRKHLARQQQIWQLFYDKTGGGGWYRCRDRRNSACSCKSGSSRRVECDDFGSITEIVLRYNRLTAAAFPELEIQKLFEMPALRRLDIYGNFRLPKASASCLHAPACHGRVRCNFGSTVRVCAPGEQPVLPGDLAEELAHQLAVWQTVYDALGGSGWYRCRLSRNNPCSCRSGFSRRVSCDSSGRIQRVVLRSNRLRASTFPEAAVDRLLSLPRMERIDFRYNGALGKGTGLNQCVKLLECAGRACLVGYPRRLCKVTFPTPAPTAFPTASPSRPPTSSPTGSPTVPAQELPCTVDFDQASTMAEFLESKGSKFFVDERSGNVMVLIRPQTAGQFSFENPVVSGFGPEGLEIPFWSTRDLKYHVVQDCQVEQTIHGGDFCEKVEANVPQCGWECEDPQDKSTCLTLYDPFNEAESFCGSNNEGFDVFD